MNLAPLLLALCERRETMMPYRQTFVIEYENSSQAPPVGADLNILGGKLHAVQFADAMAENELWREFADDETCRKVDAILVKWWRATQP